MCDHDESLQALRRVASLFVPLALCAVAYAAVPNSSTYVGDESEERVVAIAADASGNTYLTGIRYLDRVPRLDTPPKQDLFVIKQNANGSVAFIVRGGGPSDYAADIAADARGNIYVAGYTQSPPVPNGLLIKLSPDGDLVYIKRFAGVSGFSAVATDTAGNVYVAGSASGTEYPHSGIARFSRIGSFLCQNLRR